MAKPRNIIQNATRKLFSVIVSIVGIFVLILLVVFAFSKVMAGNSLAKQEEQLEILENYYASGEYEAMSAYLDEIGKTGGNYEKYRRIAELYDEMTNMEERMKRYSEQPTESSFEATEIEYVLEWSFKDLAKVRDMEECGYPYDEEKGALYIKQQYIHALETYLFLTREEIESGTLMYIGKENDYMELAEIVLQRLEEHYDF